MLKPKVATALAGTAPVAQPSAPQLKPSVQSIADYLNVEEHEKPRQFIYKIVSALQDKDLAPKIIPEIFEILQKHDAI